MFGPSGKDVEREKNFAGLVTFLAKLKPTDFDVFYEYLKEHKSSLETVAKVEKTVPDASWKEYSGLSGTITKIKSQEDSKARAEDANWIKRKVEGKQLEQTNKQAGKDKADPFAGFGKPGGA